MEGAAAQEVKEVIQFYQEAGLPYTLKHMGINGLTHAQWNQLGEGTVTIEDMANMPFKVTPDMVIKAVKQADYIGNEMLSLKHA